MKQRTWKSKVFTFALCAVMSIPSIGSMGAPSTAFAAEPTSQIHVYAPTGDNPDTPQNESPDTMSAKYTLKADGTEVPVVQFNRKGHNFDVARFSSDTRKPEFTITVSEDIHSVNIYPERYYPQESIKVSADKRTLTFTMSEAAGLNSVIVMVNGDATNQSGQPYLAIINDPIEEGAPKADASNVLNFKDFAEQYLQEHPNQEAQQPIPAGEATIKLAEGTPNEASYTYSYQAGKLVEATESNVRYPDQRKLSADDMSYAFQAALDKIYATDGLDTLYFPNGTYTYAGLEIRGRKGKNVNIYLEEGALLKNHIQPCAEAMEPAIGIWDSENITISGRGMFDGNGVENYWAQNGRVSGDRNDAYMSCHQAGVMVVRSKNITFQDTYMRNAKQWNWEAHSGQNINLNNIKGLTPYDMSWGDGTDMASSQDLTINGAFTLGNDDCFASGHYNPSRWFAPEKEDFYKKEFKLASFKPEDNDKNNADFKKFSNAVAGFVAYNADCDSWDRADSFNITVKNTLQWSCGAGNGIRLGHEAHGYQMKNYTFENFNALGFMGGGHGITVQNHTDIYPRYETLKFINCSFDTSRSGNNFVINGGDGKTQTAVGVASKLNGDTDGYTGETITKDPIREVVMEGCWFSNPTANCQVTNTTNLKISDLYVGGRKVTSTSDLNWNISNVANVEKDFADNSAPVFTSPQSDSFLATDGQTLEFDVAATDADQGDTVTLQAEGVPQGAEFNPATGHFSWTLTEAEVGNTYVIEFRASDAHTSATKTVQIQVRSSKIQVESLLALEDASVHTWKTEKDWNRNRDYIRTKTYAEALANPAEYGYLGEVKTAKDDSDLKMGLLKFDVSSLQGKKDSIEAAELSLTYMGRRNSSETGTDRIRAAVIPNADWSEADVTWNSRPIFTAGAEGYRDSAEFDIVGTGNVIMAQDDKYAASQEIDGRRVSIDITDFIKNLEEGQTALALAVNETKGYELTFVSKDGASNNQNADASMAPTILVSLKNEDPAPVVSDLRGAKVTLGQTKFTYNGKAQEPSVKVELGGKELIAGEDYTVSYTDNVDAGTAKAVIQAQSAGYTGSNIQAFTIQKASKAIKVKKASIGKVYGNGAFSLGASTAKGEKLSYSLSSQSVVKVNAGNGKATIIGCGKVTVTVKSAASKNYKGAASKKITITVKPKKVALKSAKSSKKGQITVKWGRDKKASGYQVLYGTDKKFKKAQALDVKSNKSVSKAISKKVLKGKVYYVKVRAYKTVGKTKVYGAYSDVRKVKVKK